MNFDDFLASITCEEFYDEDFSNGCWDEEDIVEFNAEEED